MVSTIKVTNRINKSRARRVGVIGRPGNLVLPDSQFISQLNEGVSAAHRRESSGHVTNSNGHVTGNHMTPGEGAGEVGVNYTESPLSPVSHSYSPASYSSSSQVN